MYHLYLQYLLLSKVDYFDLLLTLATHKYTLTSTAKASHHDTEYSQSSEASNQS